MGSLLAVDAGMRTIGLLITLLAVAPQAATDQKLVVPEGTIITSAQVTGFDINRLSPGLREEIRSLAGTPLQQQRLEELAARIEGERPRYVAAARTFMESDGQARVVFVMGRPGESDRDDNVNTRYIVEQADLVGVPDAELTDALRDDLQALVGKRLDSGEAERLQQHIERQLSGYDVSRRIQRGSERGRIRLVYEARKKEPPSWLRFDPVRSNVVYHSEHGWGSFLDLAMGDRSIRFTPIAAINDSEDLVEEDSGFGLRFETRKLGTRRLGASLEWSQFDQDWRGATLDALALKSEIPSPYSERSTFTPVLKFAIAPDLSLAAGVSITELEPLDVATDSRMANAAIASIGYFRRWEPDGSDATHRVEAGFGVRAGSRALESDLAYTRYLAQGGYRYDFGRHHVQVSALGGGITGAAPLFERFTLGDSSRLRGWDKYEIAPAGGDRVVYAAVEYRYTGVALFFDVGSVWDANTERRVRASAGFGFRAGPAFLTVGFPLNTDNLTAIFTMGLRTSGVGIRW
jgi:hypothetical protein